MSAPSSSAPTGPSRGASRADGNAANRGRGSRGRGRGARGGGAGSRRGAFGGSLSSSQTQQPAANGSGLNDVATHTTAPIPSSAIAEGKKPSLDGANELQATNTTQPPAATIDDAEEEELCFICAEPVSLYSVGPCNHRTCHICALRLRALYKMPECSYCKATLHKLVFTTSPTKDFGAFTGHDLPHSDAKLGISFESREQMDSTLILLRYNCPDERCEVASAGWSDMKMHAKRDHNRLLCDLCIRHKKIFAHEHTLHTPQTLAAHMKQDHRFCEYCTTHFYSDEEIFDHMRKKHEQCHICKASGNEEERWNYYRDYNMLEDHFKKRHYLCPAKTCLDKKFMVFESETDFKAHQVAEHGAEMSSRELKEAMKIEANFRYEDPNAVGSSTGARTAGRRGGRERRERAPEPAQPRDPLGLSALAFRTNVPGAGPANHSSRRIQFGGHTTASGESSRQQAANAVAESAAAGQTAGASSTAQHEAFLGKVFTILDGSESKLQSFRQAVKVFRAGEMGANDLVSNIYSLVGDMDKSASVVNGLVDLLDTDQGKKQSVLNAWNQLRVERTQFPSLVPLAGGAVIGSGWSSVRNVKNRATSNNQIWANVERAAARGGGQASSSSATNHFPSLGQANKFSTNASASYASVPGSASHSAKSHANLRAVHGSTPWSQASSVTRVAPPSIPSPPVPYASGHFPGASTSASKAAGSSSSRAPKTGSSSAFPSLPTNASAAALSAHKRALLKREQNSSGSRTPGLSSGQATPASAPWVASSGGGGPRRDGRIDSPTSPYDERDPMLDVEVLGDRLAGASMAQANGSSSAVGKGKKKKGTAMMSLGGVHRGT